MKRKCTYCDGRGFRYNKERIGMVKEHPGSVYMKVKHVKVECIPCNGKGHIINDEKEKDPEDALFPYVNRPPRLITITRSMASR